MVHAHILSPLMMQRPSCTTSMPIPLENTLSWLADSIRLMVWSNPFSVPYKIINDHFNLSIQCTTYILTTITLPSDVITEIVSAKLRKESEVLICMHVRHIIKHTRLLTVHQWFKSAHSHTELHIGTRRLIQTTPIPLPCKNTIVTSPTIDVAGATVDEERWNRPTRLFLHSLKRPIDQRIHCSLFSKKALKWD